MKKSITLLVQSLLAIGLSGCSTIPSNTSGAYIPTHENACRNYHKLLASKGQRYKCVELYSNGSKYDGEFINDFVRDGYGVMYYADSKNRYEGDWRNDQRDGEGVLFFADGFRYEGGFKFDEVKGFGKLYDASGVVVSTGLFENYNQISQLVADRKKESAEQQRQVNERRERDERDQQQRRLEQQRQNELAAQKEQERRAEQQRQNELAAQKERERIAKEGDGSNDDLLCKKYGLIPQTNGYAECRMRIDLAKAESKRQQENYERERAQYEQQIAAIERERERRRGAAFMELGARMMGGQSPLNALGSMGAGTPIAPTRPAPINQTITLPGGRMINCTTMGAMTNCF